MKDNIMRRNDAEQNTDVSPAVIKRLPRYFRYLRELIRNGKLRISSGELAAMMNVTASQIRQDLNCFGGFGQQGYGYNVNHLYARICEILGVAEGYRAVVVGAGNLGKALMRNPMFEKRGVDIVAAFDMNEAIVGTTVANVPVLHMSEFETFCLQNDVDIVVLTLPKENAVDAAERAVKAGVSGIWNFTGRELEEQRDAVAIENVHIGDSLMTLCYEMRSRELQRSDEEE